MLQTLFAESFLGAVYRCWTDSFAVELLRRLWRLICRLAKGSRLLQMAFGPTRGDALWAESCTGRMLKKLSEKQRDCKEY